MSALQLEGRMKRIAIAAVAVVAALAAAALARSVSYRAVPYSHANVTINAQSIQLKSGKLICRFLVINGTDQLMTIDKNQITAKLPDGRVLPRELGVFGKYAKPANVSPGLSHALDLDFKLGDVPFAVDLDFAHGFIVGGKPIALPALSVQPTG
jgi:hypothetical protein